MREFFSEIEKTIKQKEDLIFYLKEIDIARDLIEKEAKKNLKQKLEGKIEKKLFDVLLKLKEKKKLEKSKDFVFFLDLLRSHLVSLPQVKLELAFFPDEELVSKIANWFENELGKKFILDIKVNPRIVAGAVIEYQGKVLDASLIKQIKISKTEIFQ